MGCCVSKKKKTKLPGTLPLVAEKDHKRYPEPTESTQNSETGNNKANTVRNELSIVSIATEPGNREVRSIRKGKDVPEQVSTRDDIEPEIPANQVRKSKKSKKANSSSDRASQSNSKDKLLFPEDTDSTQDSEKESKPRKDRNSKRSRESVGTNTTQTGSKKESRDDFPEKTEKTQYEPDDHVY